MTTITAELLRSKGACDEQVRKFASRWPKGGKVTLNACLEAATLGLNFDWAAQNLLSPTPLKAYDAAMAEAFYAAWLIDHPVAVSA